VSFYFFHSKVVLAHTSLIAIINNTQKLGVSQVLIKATIQTGSNISPSQFIVTFHFAIFSPHLLKADTALISKRNGLPTITAIA
jgi:hypothetical protein